MREALGWETLECRRHLATATTFYKSINNLIYLPIPSSVRPADPLHVATNTNAYKYSFIPRTIPLWNDLPSYYSRHCYQSWSLPSMCPAYHSEPSATLTGLWNLIFNYYIIFIFVFSSIFWIVICVYIRQLWICKCADRYPVKCILIGILLLASCIVVTLRGLKYK